MDEAPGSKPHWAWPHVVGVLLAMVAYFIIFRFTGDADIYYAIAMGAAGWIATWIYLFPPGLLRKK